MSSVTKRKKTGSGTARRKKQKTRDLKRVVETYLDHSDMPVPFVLNIKNYVDKHARKMSSVGSENEKIKFEVKINTYRYQGIKISKHLKAPFRQSLSYWYEENSTATSNLLCHLPRTPEVEEARSRFVIGFELGGVPEEIIARFSASQIVGRPIRNWAELIDVGSIPDALDFSTVPRRPSRSTSSSTTIPPHLFGRLDPKEYLFKTIKFLMCFPTKRPDLLSLKKYTRELGSDLQHVVSIRDLHADYAQSLVYENKGLLPDKEDLLKQYLSGPIIKSILSIFFTNDVTTNIILSEEEVECKLARSNCGRYVCIMLVRDDREKEENGENGCWMPKEMERETKEIRNSTNPEKLARWAWKVLKFFYPNPTDGCLEEVIERYKDHDMYFMWDLKQQMFENSHVYESNGYKKKFGKAINFYTLVSPFDLSTVWNIIYRRMWQGSVPTVEKEITDLNGNTALYKLMYYVDPSKSLYTVVIEEKEPTNALTEVLNMAVVEEAAPSTDLRQFVHSTVRTFGRCPTEPHNLQKVNLFLHKMKAEFGEELDVIIIDFNIEDVFEAHVYRSPNHILRYGPTKQLLGKIIQKPLTFKRAMAVVFNTFRLTQTVHVEKLLTQKGDEIDIVEIRCTKSQRYMGFAFKRLTTIPYVEPERQSWSSVFSITSGVF